MTVSSTGESEMSPTERTIRLVQAEALERAAKEFDLDVASVRFIASDGYPSISISTNEEARRRVKDWLLARAEELRS